MTRAQRRHDAVKADQRAEFARDRDRILYSSAFRRLAGITQIVRSGEADVFHNRLTHSIKVAQVGRRLAELCEARYPEETEHWGLHTEVVEAACLGHDLGHPPFGHVGEHVLCKLVEDAQQNDPEGYEGNAQSFRIVTKLAVRFEDAQGLDLSRATLCALLKYPWYRDSSDSKKSKKWSVYQSEEDDFNFARYEARPDMKSLEAELMDWADDIAYSVHDLEDFHRCGAIPWHLLHDHDHQTMLIKGAQDRWFNRPDTAYEGLHTALGALGGILETVSDLRRPYDGSVNQRQQLRFLTSQLIGRFIHGLRVKQPDDVAEDESCVEIDFNTECEVRILKQITQDFILSNPALAAQQNGHSIILKNLFEDLYADIAEFPEKEPRYLPHRLRYLLNTSDTKARIVADCISSFTEAEALALHARLRGTASGSVLDPIIR